MKVAIFHDYMDVFGGAELVVLHLARALKADVITSELNEKNRKKFGFKDVNIIPLGRIIKTPRLKQAAAIRRFQRCDYSKDYDKFIMSGNFAIHASKKHHPNTWYCHTPLRGIYDLKEQSDPGFIKKNAIIPYMTHIDQKAVEEIDNIVVNSNNVRKRVNAFYGRESTVVYPPTDTSHYKHKKAKKCWLSVTRLYPEKRIHIQVEAFKDMPEETLYIVGGHNKETEDYVNEMKKDLPKNIKFLGYIKEKEKTRLLSECMGFITTAIDEDFGMTPVEAMASGKPVIASNEGGYKETVITGKTGYLIPTTPEDIRRTVKKISKDPEKYKKDCIKRAKEFDLKIFIEKMKKVINYA